MRTFTRRPRLGVAADHDLGVRGKALQDIQQQKARQCEQHDNDTFLAVRWMREQVKQGNFKGGVHEPARLSISPRDKRNIALAENPISQAMFRRSKSVV